MYLTHIGIQREFRGMNVVPGGEEMGDRARAEPKFITSQHGQVISWFSKTRCAPDWCEIPKWSMFTIQLSRILIVPFLVFFGQTAYNLPGGMTPRFDQAQKPSRVRRHEGLESQEIWKEDVDIWRLDS
jgi:hypothetical protein